MESLLVTFIGRSGSQAGRPREYVPTPYRFAGEGPHAVKNATFFGVALFQHLAEQGRPPDLLLVGTEGSSWDYLEDFFVSLNLDPPPGWDPAFRRLEEEVEEGRISRETLDQVLGHLGKSLGVQVAGLVLPTPPTPEEVHQRFLDRLQALYGQQGVKELHLDITHGYRYLGFVLLADALVLRHVWGARIFLHYGGLELRQQEAPVVDLGLVEGLMTLDEGLSVLKAVGDFRPYYSWTAGLAEEAERAYLVVETNQQQEVARLLEPLRAARPPLSHPLVHDWVVDVLEGFSGASFEEKLLNRSEFFWNRGQYFKAILLLFEALLVAGVKRFLPGQDPLNYEHRMEAREKLLEKLATLGSAAQEDYDLLRRVRNAIAHGTRPQGGDAQRAVQSLEELGKLYRRGRDLFHRIREVRP